MRPSSTREILEAAGVPADKPLELAELPDEMQAAVRPALRERDRSPAPPRRPPEHLREATTIEAEPWA